MNLKSSISYSVHTSKSSQSKKINKKNVKPTNTHIYS